MALVIVLFARWCRLSELLVIAGYRYFGAGRGRSALTVFSSVQIVGQAVVSVLVFWRSFSMRGGFFSFSLGRRLVLVGPVAIWPKSAKFES